jgi:hypothetical protein
MMTPSNSMRVFIRLIAPSNVGPDRTLNLDRITWPANPLIVQLVVDVASKK